jgi:hypothetical protein
MFREYDSILQAVHESQDAIGYSAVVSCPCISAYNVQEYVPVIVMGIEA